MKIAHVLAWVSRNAGGLFNSVSGLATATAALEGAAVRVFGVEDEFTSEDIGRWDPVPVKVCRVSGPARLCYTSGMAKEIDAFRPDIIHSAAVWTWQAAIVNGLHRRRRIPYVLSTRGTLDPWALNLSRTKKEIARRLYQQVHFEQAACIHALNMSELTSIRKFGLRNPVCVIPNGITLPREVAGATTTAFRQLSALKRNGQKMLLFLGRLHPKKGLENLLYAWEKVCGETRNREEPGWILAIAGGNEGQHGSEIMQLAQRLRLSWQEVPPGKECTGGAHGTVMFLGPQYSDGKHAAYRLCDAFVLPSFSEGLPMSVLEAWSYGKPVLMTPECNLPDGFAANAAIRIETTVESISKGLGSLFRLSNSELCSLGAAGRVLVASRFAWPKIAQDMNSVYDWVLAGGAPPACVSFC